MGKSTKRMNELYFGDCLDVLETFGNREPFIDLIYIDPPFNSKRNFNHIFPNASEEVKDAQTLAFEDTWSNVSYQEAMSEIEAIDEPLYNVLQTFHKILGNGSGAVAYLTTMSHRLWYMHRYLKSSGSFYLHCDPTMSHYLKMICDIIFGGDNFRNEIIWQRTSTHNDAKQGAKHFGRVTDTILFYAKNRNEMKFNVQYRPYTEEYINSEYKYLDESGRRHKRTDLTAQKGGGDTSYEFCGVRPYNGRYWAYSKENMEKFLNEGRLYIPSNGGIPRLKQYLDEMPGNSIDNLWTDIGFEEKGERLGYPTQKPMALLERIIKTSTDEGDLVADFFCGCGTTVTVAEKMERQWLGVDISHLAVNVIEKRLKDTFQSNIKKFDVHGIPKDIHAAQKLASETKGGRLKFQEWVVVSKLLGVCSKKGGDGGIDGKTTFQIENGKKENVLIQVKSGQTSANDVRAFCQVIEKEKASMGIFVCFKKHVKKSLKDAANDVGNFYHPSFNHHKKVKIVTVESLFDEGYINQVFPAKPTLYKSANKQLTKRNPQGKIF